MIRTLDQLIDKRRLDLAWARKVLKERKWML